MRKTNLKRAAPMILTGVSVLGVGAAAIFAARGGMKAERILSEHKEELSLKEKAKLTWKCYLFASIVALISAGCMIASHRITAKEIAKLATFATGSGAAFSKYRDKIREVLGEEKEAEIYKEAQVHPDLEEWTVYPELPHSTDGSFNERSCKYRLDFDGSVFYSNPERVAAAIYHLNRQFIINNMVSFKDFKDYLLFEEVNPTDEDYIWIDVFFYNNSMMPWIDVHETYEENDGETIHLLTFEWNPMTETQLEELDCI